MEGGFGGKDVESMDAAGAFEWPRELEELGAYGDGGGGRDGPPPRRREAPDGRVGVCLFSVVEELLVDGTGEGRLLSGRGEGLSESSRRDVISFVRSINAAVPRCTPLIGFMMRSCST